MPRTRDERWFLRLYGTFGLYVIRAKVLSGELRSWTMLLTRVHAVLLGACRWRACCWRWTEHAAACRIALKEHAAW